MNGDTVVETRFHFANLEEATQAFANAIQTDRDSFWELGDIAACAVRQFGKRGTVSALAETGRCTRQYVTIRRKCAEAYPPDVRYPDVDIALYRACLGADDPPAMLRLALEKEWSARDVMAYLHPGKVTATMVRCPSCGLVFAIADNTVAVTESGEAHGEGGGDTQPTVPPGAGCLPACPSDHDDTPNGTQLVDVARAVRGDRNDMAYQPQWCGS